MHTRIIRIGNKEPGFYTLVGPYLSRRAIVKELGSPVWDDDGKVWFVAVKNEPDAEVLGFVAYTENASGVTFQSDYLVPGARKQRIYAALFRARMEATDGKRAVAMTTKASVEVFRQNGFKVKGRRGRYYRVERTGDAD